MAYIFTGLTLKVAVDLINYCLLFHLPKAKVKYPLPPKSAFYGGAVHPLVCALARNTKIFFSFRSFRNDGWLYHIHNIIFCKPLPIRLEPTARPPGS